MKICLLSDPNYLHTQRWARYFIKRGHEVSIIGGREPRSPRLPDIQTYTLDDHLFRGPWIIRTTLALRRLLDEINPDILHMHYLGPLVAPVALRFKPFLVSVWGADIVGETALADDRWRIRFLKRLVLRKADAIIALSRFLAEATCRYARLPRERVSVYYWGVDLQHFAPRPTCWPNRDRDTTVIGFVKHLYPKYGPEYLLRAIPRIRAQHSNIKVLVIGAGTLRCDLEMLTAALGIEDIVTFCGEVPHDQVPAYMAQMDIYVMPSVYESETLGVAAIEAQAMGLPVVATKVGGVPEAVADGMTGILVPPRDPEALAGAISRLITDKDLRASMAREGPRFAAQHFDWEKNAGRVEELYRSLLLTAHNGRQCT